MAWWKRKQHDGRRPVTTAPMDAAVVLEAAIPRAVSLPGLEELVALAADYNRRLGETSNFGEMQALWKSSAFPHLMEKTKISTRTATELRFLKFISALSTHPMTFATR